MPSGADPFELPRDGQEPLSFLGYFLGTGSSQRDDKDRWTEIDIYVTSAGTFVLHVMGHSSVPGEVTRNTVSTHVDARSMVKGMAKRHGLSYVARAALESAAEMDEEVREALKPTGTPEFIE